MEDIFQLVISGISKGSFYGLLGMSFAVVYQATRVLNFAHGEFAMLGAVLGALFLGSLKLPYLLGLLLSVLVVVLVVFLLDKLVVRPAMARQAAIFSVVVSTLGIAIALSNTVGVVTERRRFYVPPTVDVATIQIGNIGIPSQSLVLIIVAIAVTLLLHWFFNKNIHGLAFRATGFNQEGAKIVGISTSAMINLAFLLAGGMAGLSGVLIAPLTAASFSMGFSLTMKSFTAAILGGLGNPLAGMIGGIIVGMAEALTAYYLTTTYLDLAIFLILILVLLVKPTGLLGEYTA